METLSNSKLQIPKDRGKLKRELDDKIARLEKELANSYKGMSNTYEVKEKFVATSRSYKNLEEIIKDNQKRFEEIEVLEKKKELSKVNRITKDAEFRKLYPVKMPNFERQKVNWERLQYLPVLEYYAAERKVKISVYEKGTEQMINQPKVSIVVSKTVPITEEVISEFCKPIVERGNADRRVSQVLTLNYATIANIADYDRCIDMPLEKRMSVKVLNLSYTTQHYELPVLMTNKATTNESVLNNLQTSSAAYGISDVNEEILKCFEYDDILLVEILPANSKEIEDKCDTKSKIFDRGRTSVFKPSPRYYPTENEKEGIELLIYSDFIMKMPHMNIITRLIIKMVFDRGKLLL